MIKVGDKEQINSFSFVVKDNEIAQAEMTFPGSNVPFRLSFTFLPGDVSGLAVAARLSPVKRQEENI